MKVAIGCDHRGYELKESLKRFLVKSGYSVADFGTRSKRSCDYPKYSQRVAGAVAGGKAYRGILICLTGIGSSIVANKFPGVRAALCHTIRSATLSRQHNDANVLVMASGAVSKDKARRITLKWLTTDFVGGRHARRVKQIARIEQEVWKSRKKWR